MANKRPHAGDMELAVASLIGYRQHAIVPNVSWGLGLRHECDMLILDSKNRFTEIEIKVSKSDLLADFKKVHGHSSNIISRLVYAVPDYLLETAIEAVPRHHGIIAVKSIEIHGKTLYKARWIRIPKHNKLKDKPNDKQIRKFMELGLMRVWTLKAKNNGK